MNGGRWTRRTAAAAVAGLLFGIPVAAQPAVRPAVMSGDVSAAIETTARVASTAVVEIFTTT